MVTEGSPACIIKTYKEEYQDIYKAKKKLIVSQALPHLLQMPLRCLFSDLN